MNVEVMSTYFPLYVEAFFLTIRIGWIGIILSLVIGILGAFILYFHVPILSVVVNVYVELFRNTPLLVQLFFLYFALPKVGITISAEGCGILGLGLLGGSYMTEAIRSGLLSVPPAQMESAIVLGFSRKQIFSEIILPQAIISGMPAVIANVIFLLKETSVFSAISLMDLMFTAKDLIGLYYDTTECLVLLVLFYMIMLLPVSILGSYIEKKVRFGTYGD